jgi:hypothetical protein
LDEGAGYGALADAVWADDDNKSAACFFPAHGSLEVHGDYTAGVR